MMQALRLSCRSEVLGLEHGGLDPVTNQLQRTYFEMALAFFRLRFVIGSKVSRHFLNQSEAKLEPFMTYTAECVCFEMWLVLVIMSSRCDRPELLL